VLAYLTYVGKLRELEFAHAAPQKGLAASVSAGATEILAWKDL
jgi:hypothetical protein